MTGYDGLTVLDARFPIRLAEPAVIFWDLLAGWENTATVISETARAASHDAADEERFIRRVREETAPMAAIPAVAAPPPPVHYAELTPASLARDDHTTDTVTAVYNPQRRPNPRRAAPRTRRPVPPHRDGQ